jgi:AraC-like DNA-binding protein
MQIRPHPDLAHLIRHYLVLRGPQPVNGVHRLFADGNTGLVFNLENATLHTAGNSPLPHSSWLYGQVNTFHDLAVAGNINWIIVVFRPYGAYYLRGIPAFEWFNGFFPAADVLGSRIHDLSAALLKVSQLNERIRLLDNFLLRQLDVAVHPDAIVVQAVEHITANEGMLPLPSLLKTLAVNERTLERKFKTYTGISPKHFSGIVRLNASAKRMQRMAAEDRLTGIAYDSGYFDQAHFIREFRKFTGMTPHQYHAEVRPLALNFLQLS